MSDEEKEKRRGEIAPWYPFDAMRSFNDLWEDLQRGTLWPWEHRPWMFPRGVLAPERWTRTPPVDLIDKGDRFIVRADVPGLLKEDLKIEITKNTLEISGETKHETTQEEDKYKIFERSYTSIHRRLSFPEKVKPDEAAATLKNGVLELEVPKAAPTKDEDKHQVRVK
jgi:HSP20 family protein